MKRQLMFIALLLIYGVINGQGLVHYCDSVCTDIRFNQLGFYPDAPKIAVVTKPRFLKFNIITSDTKKIVFSGELKASVMPGLNGKKTYIADFSGLTDQGKYVINVNGLGRSSSFEISASVFNDLAKASIKAYYYQRASTALPEQYSGKWHRAAGHPDNKVLVHASAATTMRPTGTVIASPGGWYDAGDYNKYIVNSGITMGTLFSLCEDFPDYIKTQKLNIPESGNQIPDILNEVIYNLRWMLTMQDPNDGGVYHKLTNANFDAMVMPNQGTNGRYVVQKGTAATLDFAAVTAQANRILKTYHTQLPGLADSCIKASEKAWGWARANPYIVYDQNAMNTHFEPQITTGAYGDRNFSDEFIWAAAELYITTGNKNYYTAVNILPDDQMPLPSWANVRLLGYYSLLNNQSHLSGKAKSDIFLLKKRLLAMADDLISGVDNRAYQTVMGKSKRDFNWGGNSIAANQGIALVQAYLLTKEKRYLNYALSNIDYLLGRNSTGYSYITGTGYKTPMHPHHRPSIADGVVNPIPGLMVGGANPGMQDGIKVPSIIPDEAYIDDERAYAVNEIAINWNAPLVYLINAIKAIKDSERQKVR